jgi:hypothetical protein
LSPTSKPRPARSTKKPLVSVGSGLPDGGAIVVADLPVVVQVDEAQVAGARVRLDHVALGVLPVLDVGLALEDARRAPHVERADRLADHGAGHALDAGADRRAAVAERHHAVARGGEGQRVVEPQVAALEPVRGAELEARVAHLAGVEHRVAHRAERVGYRQVHEHVVRVVHVVIGRERERVVQQAQVEADVRGAVLLPAEVGVGHANLRGAAGDHRRARRPVHHVVLVLRDRHHVREVADVLVAEHAGAHAQLEEVRAAEYGDRLEERLLARHPAERAGAEVAAPVAGAEPRRAVAPHARRGEVAVAERVRRAREQGVGAERHVQPAVVEARRRAGVDLLQVRVDEPLTERRDLLELVALRRWPATAERRCWSPPNVPSYCSRFSYRSCCTLGARWLSDAPVSTGVRYRSWVPLVQTRLSESA